MQVVLYSTFTKAKNSTVQPAAGADSVTLTGILKDESSMIDPVIKIDVRQFTGDNKTIKRFNYARIPEYGRFYFVTRKVWVNGFWEFHMHTDVMGTWRTVIGNQEQFIERSGLPGKIDDGAYQPELIPNVVRYTSTYLDNLFVDQPSVLGGNWSDVGHGTYIVTMSGSPTNNGLGSTAVIGNTYALTRDQFDDLRTELSTTAYAGLDPAVDNISQNAAKVLVNPFQYIIRCFYLPLSKAQLFGVGFSNVAIRYGWYILNTQGTQVLSPLKQFPLFMGDIPTHPLASNQLGGLPQMFRNDRWSQYYLIWPMLGALKIDSDLLINADKMLIAAVLDIFSGEVTVSVATYINTISDANYQKTVPIAHINWAIDVPLSSYLRNPTANLETQHQAVGFLPAVASALLGGNVGGVVDAVYGGIKNVQTAKARAMAADVQTVGSAGTFSPLGYARYGLMFVYWNPTCVVADASVTYKGFAPQLGVATMKRHTPAFVSTLNGVPYIIVCRDPVLFNSGYTSDNALWLQDEYDEIIGYMRSGFYYV